MTKPLIAWPLLTALILASPFQACFAPPPSPIAAQQSLAACLSPDVYHTPQFHRHPALDQGQIRAIFFEGLEYAGKPTRVFAYLGVPHSDRPLPAMVLVHGGGGTAFADWVKIWNDRGYAAISMSLEGHMPETADGQGQSTHEFSGPARAGMFDDINLPLEDQWMYHATSACMLAHSLLASLPEIDSERIGITGISWDGILASLVSGVDSRLKCAIPVYGCGFLYESKGHFNQLRQDGSEINERKAFWDPSLHFVGGSVPTLWVNGDSDAHFSINCTSRSYETTRDHAYVCIHPSMPHSHRAGWDPDKIPEIYAFADQILKQRPSALPRITRQPTGRNINLAFECEVPIAEATVYYQQEELTYRTSEQNTANVRLEPWISLPALVDSEERTVTAQVPQACRAFYVNLRTQHGLLSSSMLVELDP